MDDGLKTTSVQQVPDPDAAAGLAATYVASRPPFGSYRADKLIGSIVGQIQRRHYAFAVRGGIIVGYCGWALCTPQIARAWIENGQAPTSEQCNQGDVLVLIFAIADDRQAVRRLAEYMRKLHGGKIYMGRRALRKDNAVRRGRIR